MNELITKNSLLEMEFYEESENAFNYDVFSVDLTDKDDPWVLFSDIIFPGACTIKDLKDLMFMYFGEEEYTKRFGHIPAQIVEETKTGHTKDEMMIAFDEGFLSNDEDLSHYPNFTSEQWYAKKYEDK